MFVFPLVICDFTCAVVLTFPRPELSCNSGLRARCQTVRTPCPPHHWFKTVFLKNHCIFQLILLQWSRTLAEGRDIFLPLVFWSGGEGIYKDRKVFDQKNRLLFTHPSLPHLLLPPPSRLFSLHLHNIHLSPVLELKPHVSPYVYFR